MATIHQLSHLQPSSECNSSSTRSIPSFGPNGGPNVSLVAKSSSHHNSDTSYKHICLNAPKFQQLDLAIQSIRLRSKLKEPSLHMGHNIVVHQQLHPDKNVSSVNCQLSSGQTNCEALEIINFHLQ